MEWTIFIYSFYKGYVISPTIFYNKVQRDLDCLDILQNIALISYINDIILSVTG